jgi:hexosaminidase
MKKIYVLIFSVIVMMSLTQCFQPEFPTADQIKVSWKMAGSDNPGQTGARAMFTFENNSRFTLKSSNWALFYNQFPRKIKSCTGNVSINRISGDWHKLSPMEGFLLKPGKKCEIVVEASYAWIKESDAPLGPYFVFYDKTGAEKSVVAISDYTIEPFSESVPTAGEQYQQNLSMKEVDDSLLPLLIPTPVSVKVSGKKVIFDSVPEILYQKGLEFEAGYMAAIVGRIAETSITPSEANRPKANSVFLDIRPMSIKGVSKEAYKLEIKQNKSIIITGSDAAGVFYGIQSLIALVPPSTASAAAESPGLYELVLEDAPRFPFRGLHIDVGRDFQTKETIKKMIDLMAFYKINTLMFYLSEDEGWRIEIQELPELTEVGSRRGHTSKEAVDMLHPSYGSGPVAGAPDSWGSGYYSREDYKEILKYAQQRHVSVIPTINLPGHSRAAIKAMEARYQKFMKEGNEEKANEFRLIDPDDRSKYGSAQGYDDNVVCVARESVYKFYETVINDIIEMHSEAGVPLEFFHTGGDEVPNGAWSESPLCKKLMETLPEFKDPKNLQSYFLRRTVRFLAEKNLKIGGWEEVALIKNEEGKIVPNPEFAGKNVIPWAWNNQGEWANLSYRLANAGYPVVMCDVSKFYFDLAYNKDPQEPGLYWGGFCDARDPWQFAPYNSFVTNQKTSDGEPIDPEKEFAGLERLKPEARKNIIGLQSQLWGETIKGPKMMEYYTLPKLISFAETAWCQPRPWENESNAAKRQQLMDEGWNLFANALAKKELPRLSGLFGGFNYRIPKPGAVIEGGMLKTNIEYPGLKIKYTTDGSEPTFQSTAYNEPVQVTGEVKLKAFDIAGKSSKTIVLK